MVGSVFYETMNASYIDLAWEGCRAVLLFLVTAIATTVLVTFFVHGSASAFHIYRQVSAAQSADFALSERCRSDMALMASTSCYEVAQRLDLWFIHRFTHELLHSWMSHLPVQDACRRFDSCFHMLVDALFVRITWWDIVKLALYIGVVFWGTKAVRQGFKNMSRTVHDLKVGLGSSLPVTVSAKEKAS